MKRKRHYPPYPSSGWDYAVIETARQNLRKPNKVICIYCHGQALTESEIKHEEDCPAKKDKQEANKLRKKWR